MVNLAAPYIGPDAVDIVFRDPAPGVDPNLQLAWVDRIVPKTNCSVTVGDGTSVTNFADGASAGVAAADADDGSVAVYVIKACLPVDDDTTAIDGNTALRFDGLVYEINRDATTKYTYRGVPDHVRVWGTAQYFTTKSSELVTVVPRQNRDATGEPQPDGTPRDVMSWAVNPGNTTRRFGIAGDEDEADFTVAMPLSDPIKDNDGMIVRGRYGLVRLSKQINRWQGRTMQMCTVRTVQGGAQR